MRNNNVTTGVQIEGRSNIVPIYCSIFQFFWWVHAPIRPIVRIVVAINVMAFETATRGIRSRRLRSTSRIVPGIVNSYCLPSSGDEAAVWIDEGDSDWSAFFNHVRM